MSAADRRGGEEPLNGWKEIAAYLGKSVRSVQRWERELHLPVHRINTPDGGQIIFITRSEIDEWKRALDVGGQQRHREAPRASWFDRLTAARWRRAAAGRAVFLVLGLAIGAVSVALIRFTIPGSPEQFEIADNTLLAYTRAGTPVWRFAFGRTAHHPPNVRATMHGDVDGDGSTDVVAAVRFAAPLLKSEYSDAILAFRRDGSLIWQVQPTLQISHAGETFNGPWQVLDFEISPDRGRPRVWIAYNHQTWPPSFVLEVDPAGRTSLRYAQAGWVHSVAYWQTTAGTFLAAGGVINEHARPSVALLDVDGDPAQSGPSGSGPLSCEGCPRGAPDALVLLPPSELTPLYRRPYGWAKHITRHGVALQVATDDGAGFGSVSTIAPDLRVTSFERSDRFWQAHRAFEDAGQIGHSATECPDNRSPREVRAWTADGGWASYMVPAVMSPARRRVE